MNHKRYFLFQLKRDIPLLGVIFAILMMIGFIYTLLSVQEQTVAYYGRSVDSFLVWVAMGLGFFFPLAHKRKLYNKRSCDIYLSLPLTEKGIYLDDALLGLAEIILEFTFLYALLILCAPLSESHEWIGAVYAGYIYGYGLLALLIPYLTALGITSCANNMLDAITLLCLWGLALFLLGGEIQEMTPSKTGSYSSSVSFAYSYTFPPLLLENSLLERTFSDRYTYDWEKLPVWGPFIHLAIGAIWAGIGYFLSRNWHAEESQGPSKHFYGYPLFAGLALSFTVGLNFGTIGTANWTMMLIAIVIGTIIYWIVAFIGERKIRFSWLNVIFYGAGVAEGFLFAMFLGSSLALLYGNH
jgi:hypothetical protein